MATKQTTAAVAAVAKDVVSMRALTPLRIHGVEVAEGEVFEVEAALADGLAVDGHARAVSADPTAPA